MNVNIIFETLLLCFLVVSRLCTKIRIKKRGADKTFSILHYLAVFICLSMQNGECKIENAAQLFLTVFSLFLGKAHLFNLSKFLI